MKMTGVVAGRIDIAIEFLDELVGEFRIKELDYYVNFPNRYEVHFKNGDVYKALKDSDTLRGLKFDKLYVHKATVKVEFLSNVIPHMCIDVEYFELQ